ncbi:hypothetical protein [Sphingomonas humi]|uniref:hypothetical protein n=1 Tax=Sphingomonas humi TaxID=335630 RepID=UPI0031D03058
MQNSRSILIALSLIAVIFGVSVVATLMAGRFGLSSRLIGWATLMAMIVLTFQFRSAIGRFILPPKLAPAIARRRYRRR